MSDIYSAEVKDPAFFNRTGRDCFPGLVGLEVLRVDEEEVKIKHLIISLKRDTIFI